MLKLTIITNLTNLFNLYLNTEFTEQTKVIRFFRAFSVQIKTTFMEKIGNYCQLKAVYCHKLSAQFAAFALVQLASETLLYEVTKTITERFYLYSVYNLTYEGIPE